MRVQTGKTYVYQGQEVRVLDPLDPKYVLVTDGKVFIVQKKELEPLEAA